MKRVRSSSVLVAIAIALAVSACDEGTIPWVPDSACVDFQPGTDMTNTDFGGAIALKPNLTALAQAAGDMSVLAGKSSRSVLEACRNIALDLGADANKDPGDDSIAAWCDLATTRIQAVFSAGNLAGNIELDLTREHCEASLQGLRRCQAACAAGASCSLDSTPPVCAGGNLDALCDGQCEPLATGVPFDCAGSCSGSCSGQCVGSSATLETVSCVGFCDGVCNPDPTNAGMIGLTPDGVCHGTCTGNCSLIEAVHCTGTCNGTCDATCSAGEGTQGVTPLICSGQCTGSRHVLSCVNGAIGSGCAEDTYCQASCNAAAQAEEYCEPIDVRVESQAGWQGREGVFAVFTATIERNYPALLSVIRDQGQPMLDQMQAVAEAGGHVAQLSGRDVRSNSCLESMVVAEGAASTSFTDALNAARKVSTALGGPT